MDGAYGPGRQTGPNGRRGAPNSPPRAEPRPRSERPGPLRALFHLRLRPPKSIGRGVEVTADLDFVVVTSPCCFYRWALRLVGKFPNDNRDGMTPV
jgi:hypothetical protein